jgi:endonuclease YncB( thermonuclease family)
MGLQFLACSGSGLVVSKLHTRFALLTALGCSFKPALADVLSGRVVAVADGDTVNISHDWEQQYKVWLAGTDVSETRDRT